MNRLEPGFVLSARYRLVEPIAAGGMAQVWTAMDDVLERTVAVKVVHPQTLEQRALAERFQVEARVAAQIRHPNIVEVFDFVEDDGLAFMVMEFIDGPTLAALVAEQGNLPAEHVRLVLSQLAGALARAHENGIIHRDLKPSNVAISPDGYAKLMDFGIAKVLKAASLTTDGEMFGTAYYISPEQAMWEVLTPATDVYSLGVVGHELLTGSKPFDRGTPIATAFAHVEQEAPALPDDVPGDLLAVISACLAKDARDRPSAADIVDALAPTPDGSPRRSASWADAFAASTAPRRAYPEDEPPTQDWMPVWRHVASDPSVRPSGNSPSVAVDSSSSG
jgi:serine/threonine-protein kinase